MLESRLAKEIADFLYSLLLKKMSKITIKARFWVIPNHVLNDSKLSFKAKWLYGYIQSKPDDWDFSWDKIASFSSDWRSAVYSWLKELEEIWLLERIKQKNDKWQWEIDYILNEFPFESSAENKHWEEKKTTVDFPHTDFPHSENRQTIKKRITKKELQKKNIILIENSQLPKLSEKLMEFSEFRKAIKKPIKEESKKSFLKKLEKLSGWNEETAIEILENSMANWWQGIFPISKKMETWNFNSNKPARWTIW